MTDDEIEKRIDAAIRKANEAGLALAFDVTLEGTVCCPLGAVAFDVRGEDARHYAMEIAGEAIGRGWLWCNSFALGFDYKHRGSWDLNGYEMGARFRARYLAGEYDAGAVK